jgi:PBP1b-binding outer membrane lipoprotein LpoB
MSKRIQTLSLTLLIGLFLASCSIIVNGTTQKVNVSSDPSGATVKVNTQNMGKTPVVLNLRRATNHTLEISLDGFETKEIMLTKNITGAFWGNFLSWGIIGLAIDASTGAMYKLTPEQLSVELNKKGLSSTNKREGIYIVTTLKADKNWEKIEQLKAK